MRPHQELRIHGVSGTPPRDILYTDPVSDTDADTGTTIYKSRSTDPCFHTRAFHWANLTSGSRATAFWILLAPFALANTAGWMSGWRRNPTKAQPTHSDPRRWTARLGRSSVRSAGFALTLLFVAQALTAMVFLPMIWNQRKQPVEVFFIRISPPHWDDRVALTILTVLALFLLYGLVAWVSARSHFPEVEDTRPRTLLLGASKQRILDTHENYDTRAELTEKQKEADPGGAPITDPRLWTVHPMLHRLRRMHLGVGMGLIAIYVALVGQAISISTALIVLLVAIGLCGFLTTYLPKSGFTWALTMTLPYLSLLALAYVLGIVWATNPTFDLALTHDLTLGVALILGIFSLLSFFAGPLSVGALVLGTFVGATFGATAGLALEQLLGIDELLAAGVGWVAVAMLAFLLFLLLVAIWRATKGHTEAKQGATSPLPDLTLGQALRQLVPFLKSKDAGRKAMTARYWLMVGRRVELDARYIFYGAAVFGVASFGYSFWVLLSAGQIDSTALKAPPPWLIALSVSAVLLPIGFFAFRSIRTGWKSDAEGEGRRRQVGILWDLGSFWPRWYHPLAPPGYGPRAVKDLTDAIEEAPLPEVIGAHSQGSLIAAVTLIRSNRNDFHFVTYGSQLGLLYPRMFPDAGIPELSVLVAGRAARWVNLWRETDPIGGHFVDLDGVENVQGDAKQGEGHSGHEATADYWAIRRDLTAIDPQADCREE